jgi:site-specific recombinase XerD
MAEPEINAFLTPLAVKKKVSASTQNQALSALLFLYRHVQGREIGDLKEVIRARKPKRIPVVMTREEVRGSAVRSMSFDPVYAVCINREALTWQKKVTR